METRDLPHQREAQTGAFAVTCEPMEWREHLLALGLRHAPAAVGHFENGVAAFAADRDADRRLAMANGIIEQVADHAAEETALAAHDQRVALDGAVVVTRALLR